MDYERFLVIGEIMAKSIRNAHAGFAAFERKLISMRHVGWVRWISEKEFILTKSPFRSGLIENCSYIAPPDLHPASNSFVEVEIDGHIRQYTSFINNSIFLNYRDRYRVANIVYLNIIKLLDAAKPYLNSEDFRYRVTHNWKNAEADNLDWSLPLQIVSCAESVYGIGGIGTLSLSLSGSSKKPLKDLRSSIEQYLPMEFIKGDSDRYMFGFIDNKNTLIDIEKKRTERKIREISYNHLWKMPSDSELTPIQITTTIQNAEFKSKDKDLDPDVLEFLLTALLINPPIEESMVSRIEDDIRNVYDMIHPNGDFSTLPFDRYSTVKIANSFCRLELKEKLEDSAFDKARSIFKELSYTFLDAKEDLMATKPNRETWDVPNVEVSYLDKWRSANDTSVLRAIKRISEERNIEWVSISDIILYTKNNFKLDEFAVRDSLIRLNDLGITINVDNGNRYKIIKFS
jgi:hypothetical protein